MHVIMFMKQEMAELMTDSEPLPVWMMQCVDSNDGVRSRQSKQES